jgi:hypothetical protein
MKGFLGICSYYMRFVKGFSHICEPLIDLTRKGAFRWSQEAHVTFDKMKKVMSTYMVLSFPDFSHPFILECDALGEGIGEIIMQNRHHISYESQKMKGPESYKLFMIKKC